MKSKKVLIISFPGDIHAVTVMERLHLEGFACEFIDTSNLQATYDLLNIDDGPDVVWYRRVIVPSSDKIAQKYTKYVEKEIEALLEGFNVFWGNSRWIPDPISWTNASNKMRQLKHARDIGFTMPQTIISTKKNDVKRFAGNEPIIVKGISSQVYITGDIYHAILAKVVKPEDLDHDSLYLSPVFFQKKIGYKYEVRTVVMGDKIFSFSIESKSQISYGDIKELVEKDDMKVSPIVTPDLIQEKVACLMKRFNIEFGAIDFLVTQDNEWFFLELNPNGQWLYLEYETGYDLVGPFINFLQK